MLIAFGWLVVSLRLPACQKNSADKKMLASGWPENRNFSIGPKKIFLTNRTHFWKILGFFSKNESRYFFFMAWRLRSAPLLIFHIFLAV